MSTNQPVVPQVDEHQAAAQHTPHSHATSTPSSSPRLLESCICHLKPQPSTTIVLLDTPCFVLTSLFADADNAAPILPVLGRTLLVLTTWKDDKRDPNELLAELIGASARTHPSSPHRSYCFSMRY
ncbi:hypothetical protein B0H13DRAFT_2371772 [Mycena leptocephala]|nr:hypothetical protein B0H13DRAFT_2371772 [Mycena leptocephala]